MSPFNPDELARIAYEAYGKTTDFKNYQGLPMPTYDDLTNKIKAAWEAAVTAVAMNVLDIHNSNEA